MPGNTSDHYAWQRYTPITDAGSFALTSDTLSLFSRCTAHAREHKENSQLIWLSLVHTHARSHADKAVVVECVFVYIRAIYYDGSTVWKDVNNTIQELRINERRRHAVNDFARDERVLCVILTFFFGLVGLSLWVFSFWCVEPNGHVMFDVRRWTKYTHDEPHAISRKCDVHVHADIASMLFARETEPNQKINIRHVVVVLFDLRVASDELRATCLCCARICRICWAVLLIRIRGYSILILSSWANIFGLLSV